MQLENGGTIDTRNLSPFLIVVRPWPRAVGSHCDAARCISSAIVPIQNILSTGASETLGDFTTRGQVNYPMVVKPGEATGHTAHNGVTVRPPPTALLNPSSVPVLLASMRCTDPTRCTDYLTMLLSSQAPAGLLVLNCVSVGR